MAIKTLDEYLATIPNDDNRTRMVQVLNWVAQHYPELELRIAWNQPMFTHHGTYIIGFSAASKHMAMAPEHATIICFEAAKHVLSVRLLGVARGTPRAVPLRTSGGSVATNAGAPITTRATDVHGRC